jgi:hypothetical protein
VKIPADDTGKAFRNIGKIQRLGSCYVVRAAARGAQYGGGDAGAIFARNERGSPFIRRSTNHSCGIEHVEKHVHIKRIAKYSKRESRRCKVLLAQGVIAGEGIFRVGRAAL